MLCCRPQVPPTSPVVFDMQLLYVPGQLELRISFPTPAEEPQHAVYTKRLGFQGILLHLHSMHHATCMYLGHMALLVTA